MRADSLSSTEEVCQLSTSTSRGVFPQDYICEGTLCFLLQVKWTPRFPNSKEGRISLQRLNAGSLFISQDESMYDSTLETLQKALGLHLISIRVLTFLWHRRGLRSSVLQKLRMPDTSWVLLGISISLRQLESDPRSHASLLEASVLSCQTSLDSWGIHCK